VVAVAVAALTIIRAATRRKLGGGD